MKTIERKITNMNRNTFNSASVIDVYTRIDNTDNRRSVAAAVDLKSQPEITSEKGRKLGGEEFL
tara:strand:+ start:397 stop:588 length:192 start_codon:yes stop_codon:yes gene_type:complete